MVGRLTLTPKTENGVAFYEFSGTGALDPILAGLLPREHGQVLTVRKYGAPGLGPTSDRPARAGARS